MIDKNLGIASRLLRLLAACYLLFWLITQGQANALSALVAVAAVFLCLNTLFSRCYLTYLFQQKVKSANKASVDTGNITH